MGNGQQERLFLVLGNELLVSQLPSVVPHGVINGSDLAGKLAGLCRLNPHGKRWVLEDKFVHTQKWVALESISYQCPRVLRGECCE